jgi:single-stranded-DNA-specific exonuclease
MADAHTALTLLTTDSPDVAHEAARKLEEHNRERQRLTEEGTEKGRAIAIGRLADGPVLVVEDESFAIGVVGLIAARLSDEFSRPAIALAADAGRWRGSARSVAGFDIGAAIADCADLLVKHGGHPMAAGLTVAADNLGLLRCRLNEIGEQQLAGSDLRATLWLDAELSLREAWAQAFPAFRRLPPYGLGNPEPVFLARGVEVKERRTVGTNGAHLKLTLAEEGFVYNRTIGFGLGALAQGLPRYVDLAYSVVESEWNGRCQLELRLRDVRPAGSGAA